jgi:hypothetical protein
MNWVTTSTRLYAALVRLYPRRFREAYGDELQLLFRDCTRDGYQRAGAWGVLNVWLGVLPDLVISAADQHAEEDPNMNRTARLKGLSVIGVVGGAWWVIFGLVNLLRSDDWGLLIDDVLILFMGIGAFCVGIGLIALILGPGRTWPLAIRLLLLIPVVCGAYSLVMSALPDANWIIRIAGLIISMAAVLLAGAALLTQGQMRLWGLLLLGLGITQVLINGEEDWRPLFLTLSGAVAIGLMVLLYRRQGETPALA